jgi:hypothetical protein
MGPVWGSPVNSNANGRLAIPLQERHGLVAEKHPTYGERANDWFGWHPGFIAFLCSG